MRCDFGRGFDTRLKSSLIHWIEGYFYAPTPLQKLLSYLLLPLSWLYCLGAFIRYRRAEPQKMGIPIVSIGNLTVGGSGKTPLTSALAGHFHRPAIVLRGYGRQSRGLVVVQHQAQLLCDVVHSGDEAMLYTQMLPHATVIVAEKREEGIQKARELGCEMVFLDDGYGKHAIKKLDLLIEVPTPNRFCLPSGPYREKLWKGKSAVIVEDGRSFKRSVEVLNPTSKMVLVTAIARPERLDPFLPEVVEVYFEDHHFFTEDELDSIIARTGATSLLVTQKDFVKMSSFKLTLSILDLSLELDESLVTLVKDYVDATQD